MNENCKQCCNSCQKPDADGWIEWLGGKLPVHRNLMVEVQFSSLETASGIAESFYWHDKHGPHRIYKYRIKSPDDIRSLQKSLANEIGTESLEVCDFFLRGSNFIVTSKHGSINDMCEKVKEENKGKKIDSNPTIEQLAREYRSDVDALNLKLREAEEARSYAKATFEALRKACNAVGLEVHKAH
jgi:hypothetical protein